MSEKTSKLSKSSSQKTSDQKKDKDVVLVHGVTEDGSGYHVLRQRKDRIEAGYMHQLEEGKPIHGEVVKLTPRKESSLLFDSETQHSTASVDAEPSSSDASPRPNALGSNHAGPARVANHSYREGWDVIWGSRRRKKRVLN